jgi:hypothetical protein
MKLKKHQVLYEKISMRLKGKLKFYRSVLKPTMHHYGSESWVVNRRIEQSMSVAEMRMLRMSGVAREDSIRNEYVKGSIGVL